MPAPLPPQEDARLAALFRSGMLATRPGPALDRLARLAALLFDAPWSAVSLVARDEVRVVAGYGVTPGTVPRAQACAAHVIVTAEPLVVPDLAAAPGWAGYPPGARFYAAAPLVGTEGYCAGALEVFAAEPRSGPAPELLAGLRDLAALVSGELARGAEVRLTQATVQAVLGALAQAAVLVDTHGRIGAANTAAAQQFGYEWGELIGQPVSLLLPEREHTQHRQPAADSWADPAQWLMGGHRELLAWRRDGSEFPAEVSLSQVVTAEGQQALVIVTDISARKANDEALRESEARFRSLTLATASMVWETDGLGQYVTPQESWAHYTGHGWDMHQGFGWADALHPDDRERVQAEWRQAVADRPPVAEVYGRVWHAATRQYRHCVSRGVPVLTPDRRIGAWVGTVTDLEDRLRLEDAVRQSAKMEAVGRLAGGLAHDFNNLLQVISGNVELLAGDVETVPPELEVVRRAAERAADLTRQLLAFSRQQPRQPVVLDLAAAVRDVQPLLQRLMGPRIRLDVQVPAQPVTVRVDPSQLEQVVLNLAVNARDAMPQGGTLTIEVWPELPAASAAALECTSVGPMAALAVTDTGAGMDEAVQARIFEPFFTTKELGKGTGLGLATVYGVVQQSGGVVRVRSDPGQGTTFVVGLPLVPEQPLVESAAPAGAVPGQGWVLLVEDDADGRFLAARGLRRSGYDVLEAGSGSQALELLEAQAGAVDAVITDIGMPGMDGFSFVRRLREIRPDLPVLFMSGYAEHAALEKAIAEPHTAFLPKPFGAAELTNVLAALLRQP